LRPWLGQAMANLTNKLHELKTYFAKRIQIVSTLLVIGFQMLAVDPSMAQAQRKPILTFEQRLQQATEKLKLYPSGRSLISEVQSRGGKIKVLEDQNRPADSNGTVDIRNGELVILVAPNRSSDQLAEIFVHEFEHYKDLQSILNHLLPISEVSRTKILPAQKCLKDNSLPYCVEVHGANTVWFNIISLFYLEYKAFRTQIMARNEGLKTNVIDVVVNGRPRELDLEILPAYINEAYFKTKLNVSLSLQKLCVVSLIWSKATQISGAFIKPIFLN
jgi:hypothetical protein